MPNFIFAFIILFLFVITIGYKCCRSGFDMGCVNLFTSHNLNFARLECKRVDFCTKIVNAALK